MTLLRAQLTTLLITTILTVAGLAALATGRALRPPNPGTIIELVAPHRGNWLLSPVPDPSPPRGGKPDASCRRCGP